MEELKKLLESTDKAWAVQRATMALDIAAAMEAKEITEMEYKELLEDLIRTDRLESEADDIAVKTALIGAIKGLVAIS